LWYFLWVVHDRYTRIAAMTLRSRRFARFWDIDDQLMILTAGATALRRGSGVMHALALIDGEVPIGVCL